jgi:serine/threonine protein kinase/ankyrin repeat protein
MNTEWDHINQLFHQAMECPQEERAAFVARACFGDARLQQELQSLLATQAENNSFMEIPPLKANLSRHFGSWRRQITESITKTAGQGSADADPMIGLLLDGKYEIEALCGRGGMGSVYRATHVGTGRRVAVKVIAPELAGESEFIARFRQEAKTIGLLRHPNIVNVTDFGVTGAGEKTVAYLVMEYLEGRTLAERLKNRQPVSLNEAVAILRQACEAMDEAHRVGILHRDLKPENIWLESPAPKDSTGSIADKVKVLDFGIARLHDFISLEDLAARSNFEESEARPQPFSITEEETLRLNKPAWSMSQFSVVMGTPKYMSPEQCRGERLDRASDVYSLGVIAYQMLTGETPFSGTPQELLRNHRETNPVSLRKLRRGVPTGVDAVVQQALAKDKNARPATAGAFAFQLRLQAEGSVWLRGMADALADKHRWKLATIVFRVQWKGWLFSLLLPFATLALPGMSAAMTVAAFVPLWALIAAIALRGQNEAAGAVSLFLERTAAGASPGVCSIVADTRRRNRDLTRATFTEIASPFRGLSAPKLSGARRRAPGLIDHTLTVPPLVCEPLSVKEAGLRSARLIGPIRRQAAYAFFRRAIVFVLGLTALQQLLLAAAFPLDRGLREFNTRDVFMHNMRETLFFWPPVAALVVILFIGLSMKSAVEQFVLYLAARKALGEVPLEQYALVTQTSALPGREARRPCWQTKWMLYGSSCAALTLIMGFHTAKFPWMMQRATEGDLYSVRASNVSGVPVPFGPGRSVFQIWSPAHPQEMMRYLIEKGADVNAQTDRYGRSGWSLLMEALSAGSIDVARLLIEFGADPHARDSSGKNPLTIAITNCPAGVEPLLAAGVGIHEQTLYGSPLLAAARYQWMSPQTTFFFPPRDKGLLNTRGSFIGLASTSDLDWRNGQIQEKDNVVRILLEKGADPNTRDDEGRNGLMLMSMDTRNNGRPELTIETLGTVEPFQRMGRVDKAVELIGEALLNAGCDVNATDKKGRTPLMYAVIFERRMAVEMLLKRGASVTIRDNTGASAIDRAMRSGNDEIFKLVADAVSSKKR